MRNPELDGEQTMEQRADRRPCFLKPKSCVVSAGAYSTYDVYGQKARQTKTARKARSLAQNIHRNYQSIVLLPERVIPETANRCNSDSGISRNSSMVSCLESQLHFIPTWFDDDRCSEFNASERRLGVHRDRSVSCNSVSDRHARSSIIFSNCDSPVKLCQSCNTYYEVTPSPESRRNLRYQDLDIPTKISNVFWKLQLTMSPFVRGNNALDFGSLWPSEQCIGGVLLEACSTSSALVENLCKFVTLCEPLHVLKFLLNLNIIALNHTFPNGFGLLHMACLAQNSEAVSFLVKAGVPSSLRDSQGCLAVQRCYSSTIFSLLPSVYHHPSPSPHHPLASKFKKSSPTLLDRRKIFEMARNAADIEKLLVLLQTLEFDVNKEVDDAGDLVTHIAVREGLSQVPLLLLLTKLFKADINHPNKIGMTCLMLAASMGVTALVDLLLCVFNANPDSQCCEKKWTALHFACYEQHSDVVNVLLRRGADYNKEDENRCRPDDLARRCGASDCQQAVEKHRKEFIRHLKLLVKENNLDKLKRLQDDDLCVVSDSGYTMIMWAVKFDRMEILEFLLDQHKHRPSHGSRTRWSEQPASYVDAQHLKTLQTALAFAVIYGRRFATKLLMQFGADPRISDIQKRTPLHHAVIRGDIESLKILLQYNAALSGLKRALELTKIEELIVHLKAACNRRQSAIVNPELFENSISGDSNRLYCVLEEGDGVNPFFGGDYWSIHPSTGNTVLHVACNNNHVEIVRYLITRYGETKEMSHLLTDHLNLFNFRARTPLMLAAEAGNSNLVLLLLEHGASTSVLTPGGDLFRCDHFAGVQFILEQHHKRHCEEVFAAIYDKKGLRGLTDIFLPFHDHNLRDPESGDSPLMTAARLGRIKLLEFLLQSFSYPMFRRSESTTVNDRTKDKSPTICDEDFCFILDEEVKDSSDETPIESPLCDESSSQRLLSMDDTTFDASITSLLGNMNSICQQNPVLLGNRISQTCAVNNVDKCTVFHRIIENGDSVVMLNAVLESDQSAVNMQNAKGYGPLHLAVKLGRRKIVQKLTTLPFVDVNLRALDGTLAEDLTSNVGLRSLVLRARNQQQTSYPRCPLRSVTNSVSGADRSISHASEPVNFDRLNARFARLKEACRAPYV